MASSSYSALQGKLDALLSFLPHVTRAEAAAALEAVAGDVDDACALLLSADLADAPPPAPSPRHGGGAPPPPLPRPPSRPKSKPAVKLAPGLGELLDADRVRSDDPSSKRVLERFDEVPDAVIAHRPLVPAAAPPKKGEQVMRYVDGVAVRVPAGAKHLEEKQPPVDPKTVVSGLKMWRRKGQGGASGGVGK